MFFSEYAFGSKKIRITQNDHYPKNSYKPPPPPAPALFKFLGSLQG